MRTAAITGAGSGVGRSLAVELARRSWNVALIGHGETSLAETSEQVREHGMKAKTYVLDVADAVAVRDAARQIVRDIGPISAWVNAAAVGVFGPVVDADDIDLDRVMEVSYNGVVHGSRAAVESMMAAGEGGAIVNMGSALAFTTVPYNVPYGAAKAAVRSFSLGLGLELRRHNITVCVAHLPAIATPWFAKVKTLTPFRSQPVGSVHSPEAIGIAMAELVERPRLGDSYLGLSTLFVVLGARVFPRLTAWVAGTAGVRLQTTRSARPKEDNLWRAVEPPPKAPAFGWTTGRTPRWWPRIGRRARYRAVR